jgi:signal peptidase II
MQATPGTPLNERGAHIATEERAPTRRLLWLFAAVAVIAYVLDIVTKFVAVDRLRGEPPIELVGGLLTLRLTSNPGAAFSLGTDLTVLLTAISIAVVVVVLWIVRRIGSPLWAVALGLLLGGAAGNLTDRILREPAPFRGHVVDFLELPNWPVFNLADSAIVVGAVLVVVQSLRGMHLDGRRATS